MAQQFEAAREILQQAPHLRSNELLRQYARHAPSHHITWCTHSTIAFVWHGMDGCHTHLNWQRLPKPLGRHAVKLSRLKLASLARYLLNNWVSLQESRQLPVRKSSGACKLSGSV